jgi:ribosome-associated protein
MVAGAEAGQSVPIPSADDLVALVNERLDEEKAEEIVTINLRGKSDVADTLVIASGRSQRHVGALADKIGRALKDAGLGQVKTEGLPSCDWVLLDAGDVVIHLFRPEVRDFYNLERIWAPERFPPSA